VLTLLVRYVSLFFLRSLSLSFSLSLTAVHCSLAGLSSQMEPFGAGFPLFTDECDSLVKKHLTVEMYEALKDKVSQWDKGRAKGRRLTVLLSHRPFENTFPLSVRPTTLRWTALFNLAWTTRILVCSPHSFTKQRSS
jgi:hypothetical protein